MSGGILPRPNLWKTKGTSGLNDTKRIRTFTRRERGDTLITTCPSPCVDDRGVFGSAGLRGEPPALGLRGTELLNRGARLHPLRLAFPLMLCVLLLATACDRGWALHFQNLTDDTVLVYSYRGRSPSPGSLQPAGFLTVRPRQREGMSEIDDPAYRREGIRIEMYRLGDGRRIMCRWLAYTPEAVESNPHLPYQWIPPPGNVDLEFEIVDDPSSCDPLTEQRSDR